MMNNYRNMLSKRICLLLSSVLISGLAAGCSDKKSNDSADVKTEAVTEAVTTTAENKEAATTSAATSAKSTTTSVTTTAVTTTQGTTTTTFAVTVPPDAVNYADPDINDSIRECLNILLNTEENLLQAKYMLTDVNGDYTPEIVLRYDNGDWYDAFFVYKNGKYEKCDLKALTIYTCKEKGMIGTSFYDGSYIYGKYKLNADNELERVYYYNEDEGVETGTMYPELTHQVEVTDEFGNTFYVECDYDDEYNCYYSSAFQTCEPWDAPDFTTFYNAD